MADYMNASVGTNFVSLIWEIDRSSSFQMIVDVFFGQGTLTTATMEGNPGVYRFSTYTVSAGTGSDQRTFTHGGLPSGTTYSFHYVSYVRQSNGTRGSVVRRRPLPPPGFATTTTPAPPPPPVPAAPTGLSVSGITSSSLTLNWNGVSGASSYTATLNGVAQGNTANTFFTFTGLASSTSYTLGVRANNSSGSSSTSTISGTTAPPPTPTQTYSIFYNGNGSTGGSMQATQITTTSTSQALTVAPNAFTRSNHVFVSWNTSANGQGTTYLPGQTITLNSPNTSITLFAIWKLVGKRMTGPSSSEGLVVARRFDGTDWIALTTMKRFDGTNWVDISNT